jgi:hypothetical protein
MEYLISAVIVGVIATLTMDGWMIVRRRLFGLPAPDYALVGRWLAWMPRGRFKHASMAAVPSVAGERCFGWIAHYLIGIAFAALLLALYGTEWLRQPMLLPALIVGIGTVVAPFFLMQPGMGSGIAASRTPRPNAARVHSLITHTIFGVGLYAGGFVARICIPPSVLT